MRYERVHDRVHVQVHACRVVDDQITVALVNHRRSGSAFTDVGCPKRQIQCAGGALSNRDVSGNASQFAAGDQGDAREHVPVRSTQVNDGRRVHDDTRRGTLRTGHGGGQISVDYFQGTSTGERRSGPLGRLASSAQLHDTRGIRDAQVTRGGIGFVQNQRTRSSLRQAGIALHGGVEEQLRIIVIDRITRGQRCVRGSRIAVQNSAVSEDRVSGPRRACTSIAEVPALVAAVIIRSVCGQGSPEVLERTGKNVGKLDVLDQPPVSGTGNSSREGVAAPGGTVLHRAVPGADFHVGRRRSR